MVESKKSYCGLCHPRCGALLHIEDGRIVKVFESSANCLCPDAPEFCSPEIGSWPHSALLCRIEKEAIRT